MRAHMMFSRFSSPPASQGKPRLVDEPPTPAPLRRHRPPRPEPHEKKAESTTADSEEAAADKPMLQAVHFGPIPKIVHFDLPGIEDEEEEVSGSYFPPGVPVPPSRLQIFASRPRRRKIIREPPSQEVQTAMAQLRAEIKAMENPRPTSWIGRLMESLLDTYRNKRDYRRNHGLAERPGFVRRMKRSLAPVREAMRRFLHVKKNTDERQLPTDIDSTMFSRFSSPPASQGKPRLVDEPLTPAPLRRLRSPRPEPHEKKVESTTTDSEEAAADKPMLQAVHFGPRPRIVHFDLPGVKDEEEEVSGSYYPPGVPVPPSRLQIFASRPRRRKIIREPPSQEVQTAMAQLRAEIHAMMFSRFTSSSAGQGKPRMIDKPPTPAPLRRLRPPRPEPNEKKAESSTADSEEAAADKPLLQAVHFGPRPRIVHFDLPGIEDEEEEVSGSYHPPGVPVPPSRLQIFANRPRRRKIIRKPPSQEVQIAMAQLRAEIQEMMFSQICSPAASQGKPRLVDESQTPAPLRRLRPSRPEPNEKKAESTTTDSKEAVADKPLLHAVHFGPRPRIVHFDLPGVEDEEEEVSGSYYPPGVPVPPSRLQIFANRPRRRKIIREPPSQEVQTAMAQLRAEIHPMENPPPTSRIGRLMESLLDMYRNKGDYRRNRGLAERPGFFRRMKRRLAPVREAMRRFLYLKKNTDERQLPTGIDSTLCDYILHCEHPDPKYSPIIPLISQLLETSL
ncbi:serine/arginine repetitive matrix protein 1-like [Schistocerca gregaria]|uniref:serine/arginine repetitive matrix protein 1-like n=1 Tax=Schistocerca gregaria TaxID=7010 RepID=UPI00211F0584|nr:serine/arginine repetitive matrix protein 1-like [Schistocerca gregaria]